LAERAAVQRAVNAGMISERAAEDALNRATSRIDAEQKAHDD
jgi:hypothetical protein